MPTTDRPTIIQYIVITIAGTCEEANVSAWVSDKKKNEIYNFVRQYCNFYFLKMQIAYIILYIIRESAPIHIYQTKTILFLC